MSENGEFQNNAPVKVVSQSGYVNLSKVGYGGDILGMLISLVLIFGGLSGRLVLRGTNSSTALVVVGFLLLAWDIFSLTSKIKKVNAAKENQAALEQKMHMQEDAVLATPTNLGVSVGVRIEQDKALPIAVMDFSPRLNGVAMTMKKKEKAYIGSTDRVRNIINFNNMDLTVAFDVTAISEIVIRLQREDGDQYSVILPSNVKVLSLVQQ